MKVTIHAEGTQAEIVKQLQEAVVAFGGGQTVTGRAPEAAVAEVKAPKKSKKAAEPAEEEEEFDLADPEETEEDESEDEESEDEEEAEEESEEEEAPAASLQDVIVAFQKYAKKHSREKAALILKKMKVKSVHELKPAQFADVLKLLK